MEDPDRWVREALERNRDLRAMQAEIEARQVYSRAAAWEALPSLDLIGSVGGNGLGGDPRSVVFGTDTLRTNVSGSLGDALRQAVNRDYPSWRVGLELSVPIGLRSGLGEQDRLDAEVVIAEQRYAQVARLLEEEVRARCRELLNGQRRLTAARASVDAAREQVRIVRIEYQNGRSTAFELVRVGADFAVAEQRYSQALVRSAKAAASLRQLTSGAFGTAGHPTDQGCESATTLLRTKGLFSMQVHQRGVAISSERVAAIALVLLLAGCRGSADRAGFAMPPMPVEASEVARREMVDRFEVVGTIEALAAVTVVGEIDALVTALPFAEGSTIKKGDLIAQLDGGQLAAEVARAEALRAQTKAIVRAGEEHRGPGCRCPAGSRRCRRRAQGGRRQSRPCPRPVREDADRRAVQRRDRVPARECRDLPPGRSADHRPGQRGRDARHVLGPRNGSSAS